MGQRRAVRSRFSSRGAALLEMSLVVSLLCLLLFGIIEFGYIMSFRGSMAQSAAEGARAAATAPRPLGDPVPADCSPGNGMDDAEVCDRAADATKQAVGGFNQTCNHLGGGLTCDWKIFDCLNAAIGDSAADKNDCISVTLEYDWAGHPILPEIPLISGAIPDTLKASSVVELNQP